MFKTRKVVIVGAGHVGSHVALALIQSGEADDIVLIDILKEKAIGQALDLDDCVSGSLCGKDVSIRAGSYEELHDADIMVMAFGRSRRPGETRLDMFDDSIKMANEVVSHLKQVDFRGIMISISNPADIICEYIRRQMDWQPSRCFCTGTSLETYRLLRDKTAAQIKQLNGEKTAANSRLNTLRSKRDSLGLFAVKERKRLDGEISEIAAGLKQLELKLDSALKQLGGFESKAAADKALSTARADVSSLQNRINESALTGSGEFSCSQALKVLLAKPRVFQLVSKKQPRLASSYKGFVTIAFGRYPQASNNESALIEWLVLKNDGSKALLISKYALDCQRYNTSGRDVTWETCTLRRWLNGSFINSAFSAEEQKQILHTTVTADRNPSSNTDPGNNTTDKVFLLSRAECSQYLVLCDARSCEGTAYCFAQGAAQQDVYGGCRWWLRSPADYSGCVICVNDNGTYASAGCSTFSDGITVRPALWINLGS